jgi:hypothetical protein
MFVLNYFRIVMVKTRSLSKSLTLYILILIRKKICVYHSALHRQWIALKSPRKLGLVKLGIHLLRFPPTALLRRWSLIISSRSTLVLIRFLFLVILSHSVIKRNPSEPCCLYNFIAWVFYCLYNFIAQAFYLFDCFRGRSDQVVYTTYLVAYGKLSIQLVV